MRLVAASLSGQSDAEWARVASPYVDRAVLGGIALDEPSRTAARELVARDREEFLPADPLAFVDEQLAALSDVPLETGVNVRSTSTAPIRAAGEICRRHDAICEINAHCRQAELRRVGCGETLLADTDRLCEQVRAAAETGARVSVKVRAEVPGVDLVETARAVERAGAGIIHVDAMDSEPVVLAVCEASELSVIANNGVRGRESVAEYAEYGADAVSVGRPSDDPRVLTRVREAVDELASREAHV
ncbi:tRNA-dihydrouridine synthase [Halalkalicoccus jeotgali]|uniref:Dihydropyrimidine dehydrogenase n=1 Tax=Halalkalicoccus jeotgali (strain DSM 18796 / CECT 7217 / JCM 14584 / KCTC 4019 / B3) TaxID=795797 RepID=D8JAR9_HALJB|nr:tRNA-dihydrouridine synthase [Halalkalicoccus jeotgali]ADJ14791.1 dihydropyrimidine dehydrogenase [Halalkalicoccus jeotgali B3]ELY39373.1 dihydropyrimidine dehydrogenase [Halalkalicoccus jeotgali B3]